MRRGITSVVSLGFVLLVWHGAAFGQTTWHVDAAACPGPGTGTALDPFCTIQDGIDAAYGGDTVQVADGVYNSTGNRDLDFAGKAITVRSVGGASSCTIDCGGSPGDPHRGFYFHNGEVATSVVEGFTISGGYVVGDESGGGMRFSHASPVIRDCVITGNVSDGTGGSGSDLTGVGGGIYCASSNPLFDGCEISYNESLGPYSYGGGAYLSASDATFLRCTIQGNVARDFGGGMSCEKSSATITDCLIIENEVDEVGGGIDCFDDSDLVITNTIIAGNYAGYWGAGMAAASAAPTIRRCTIAGNITDYYGGGVHLIGCVGATISSTVIANNYAEEWGGAIRTDDSIFSLVNCTLAANEAADGSGIACQSGGGGSIVTIKNSILFDGGDEIWNDDGSIVPISDSDVEGGWPGNLSVDPMFVDPDGPDDDPYTWAGNNFRLATGSPCVDTGNNAAVVDTWDRAGNDRVLDGDFDESAVVDIGAFELLSEVVPATGSQAGMALGLMLVAAGAFVVTFRRRAEA